MARCQSSDSASIGFNTITQAASFGTHLLAHVPRLLTSQIRLYNMHASFPKGLCGVWGTVVSTLHFACICSPDRGLISKTSVLHARAQRESADRQSVRDEVGSRVSRSAHASDRDDARGHGLGSGGDIALPRFTASRAVAADAALRTRGKKSWTWSKSSRLTGANRLSPQSRMALR